MNIATYEEVVEGPDGCICHCTCYCTCSLDTASQASVGMQGSVAGGAIGALITRG